MEVPNKTTKGNSVNDSWDDPTLFSDPPNNNQSDNEGNKKDKESDKKSELVIGINRPKYELKSEHISNLINFGMLVVTSLLFYFTWKLYDKTVEATTISNKSAEAAIASVETAKIANEISKNSLNNEIVSGVFKDSLALESQKLTYKSVESQIQSLNQERIQFEAEHSPFIQIYDVVINKPQIGQPVVVSYNLYNLTNIPVKITSIKKYIGSIEVTANDIENKYYIDDDSLSYLTKDNPIERFSDIIEKANAETVETLLNNPNVFIYFGRKVSYTNLVTGRDYEYTFLCKIKPLNDGSKLSSKTFTRVLCNENKLIINTRLSSRFAPRLKEKK